MVVDLETCRRLLGIRYCPTCDQDAMILDAGYCPWCLRYPETGELDFAAAAKDREDRRKARLATNSQRYRERARPARSCRNCDGPVPKGRSKFCSTWCVREWWRKKQNADRQAAA